VRFEDVCVIATGVFRQARGTIIAINLAIALTVTCGTRLHRPFTTDIRQVIRGEFGWRPAVIDPTARMIDKVPATRKPNLWSTSGKLIRVNALRWRTS